MKRFLPLCVTIAAALIAGCAGPEFQPYAGDAIRQGTGGTYRIVKGMPVWDGTPPRKFQILGVFDEEGGRRANVQTLLDDHAKAARQHGADALILMGAQGSNFFDRARLKVALIKYL